MDPFAAFALTVGSVIAISNHAALMEHYARRAQYYPVAVAVEPAWEPAPPVAYLAPPPPAAYVPALPFPIVAAPPAPVSRRPAGVAARSPAEISARIASTQDFTHRWQDFMQPAISRPAVAPHCACSTR